MYPTRGLTDAKLDNFGDIAKFFEKNQINREKILEFNKQCLYLQSQSERET